MTIAKALVVILSVLFFVIVSTSIFTLTITASEGGIPAPFKRWCLGRSLLWPCLCGRERFCAGSGNYICCKQTSSIIDLYWSIYLLIKIRGVSDNTPFNKQ